MLFRSKSLPLPIPCLDPDIATLKTPTAPEHTLVLDSPHSPTEARVTILTVKRFLQISNLSGTQHSVKEISSQLFGSAGLYIIIPILFYVRLKLTTRHLRMKLNVGRIILSGKLKN